MADTKLERIVTSVAGSPWNKVIVTLLGAFAGLLGAVYTDEIKSTLPLAGIFQKHHALEFWAATAVSAFLFFSVQWAADRKRSKSEDELRNRAQGLQISSNTLNQKTDDLGQQTKVLGERTDNLNQKTDDLGKQTKVLGERTDDVVRKTGEVVKLIQTLPPAGFISDLGQYYQLSNMILSKLRKSPPEQLTVEATQASIRAMLANIAALAHKFDATPAAVVYGANVMLFRPLASIPPTERKAVQERMPFYNGAFEDLEGVLDLQLPLSAAFPATVGAGSQPDSAVQKLALPIPKPPYTIDDRTKVLPGASLAFVEARAGNRILDGYADTTLLGVWCQKHSNFSYETCKKIGDYFKPPNDRIRSMVSLPISSPEDPHNVVGIFNIHRSQTGLLRMAPQKSSPQDSNVNKDEVVSEGADLGPATDFALLIRPLVGILWNLIEFMVNIK
jgi:hypothetical protein